MRKPKPDVPRRHLDASSAGLFASPLLRSTPAPARPALPARPVTVVLPLPLALGGSNDVLTRLMAEALGRPVQPEDRSGSNTITGAGFVARAQSAMVLTPQTDQAGAQIPRALCPQRRGGAMKRKRYTDERIAFALRRAEDGTPVEEICRKMGVSEPTFYRWTGGRT